MMSQRTEAFWDALGALTFAEAVAVAETMRDACEAFDEFDRSDIQQWSFLLNTAREIAEDRTETA